MNFFRIADSGGTEAIIAPEKGAAVVQLTKNGVDFLYRNDENLQSVERPRCGIPFLFPIFGRLKDETYRYDGNPYHMPIHGFAHTSSWQVVRHTGSMLQLELAANEQTLKMYPFHFRVTLVYSLEDGILSIQQYYENLDSKIMPYNYGFHPYFRADKLENAQVEATAALRIDFSAGKALPFGHGTVSLSIPEGMSESGAAFAQIQSPAILHIPNEGRRITMEFDDSFSQMILWTLSGKPFLCVEPINGTPDGLNTGNYLTLEPGCTHRAVVRIIPEII